MKLSADDLGNLADLAISAATAAGQMIAESRPQQIQHKEGALSLASQVVTEIDVRSEEMILEALEPSVDRYELGLLTEETEDDGGRLTSDYFWCIDPIDGTLPFIEGTPGYAVSIALVGRDGIPWIGVIYDPVESVTFHAVRGVGSFRNASPWPVDAQSRGERLAVFGDRSFREADNYHSVIDSLEQVAQDLGLGGVDVQPPAGAVMNACGVLANAPGCYFRQPGPLGGASSWDFAATACLFEAARAVATDIHGGPLDLNRTDSTYMNHRGALYATDADVAQRIRALSAGDPPR